MSDSNQEINSSAVMLVPPQNSSLRKDLLEGQLLLSSAYLYLNKIWNEITRTGANPDQQSTLNLALARISMAIVNLLMAFLGVRLPDSIARANIQTNLNNAVIRIAFARAGIEDDVIQDDLSEEERNSLNDVLNLLSSANRKLFSALNKFLSQGSSSPQREIEELWDRLHYLERSLESIENGCPQNILIQELLLPSMDDEIRRVLNDLF